MWEWVLLEGNVGKRERWKLCAWKEHEEESESKSRLNSAQNLESSLKQKKTAKQILIWTIHFMELKFVSRFEGRKVMTRIFTSAIGDVTKIRRQLHIVGNQNSYSSANIILMHKTERTRWATCKMKMRNAYKILVFLKPKKYETSL